MLTDEEVLKAFQEMDIDQDSVIGPDDVRIFFRSSGLGALLLRVLKGGRGPGCCPWPIINEPGVGAQ